MQQLTLEQRERSLALIIKRTSMLLKVKITRSLRWYLIVSKNNILVCTKLFGMSLKMYEIHGKVFQDGDMWLSEIPRLNLMTQGTSRTDAIEMIIDAIKCLSDEFIHLRLF